MQGTMRVIRRLIVLIFVLCPLLALGLIAFLPGPHRAIAPAQFGLSRIAPGVYTDAPTRQAELTQLLARADSRVAAIFGSATPRPRTVLCTAEPCRATFGLTGRAITLGDLAVVVAPLGIREATLVHEQIHIELSARMGPLDALWPRYPAWFNEGLATHISGTPGVLGPARVADAQWITSAQTALGWRLAKRGRTGAEYYGAARRLVAEIEAQIGTPALVDLIEDVAQGADFRQTLDLDLAR
ncbi:MAG: hypothetical protein AAFW64_07455 [Pseudomonadota bacterium]